MEMNGLEAKAMGPAREDEAERPRDEAKVKSKDDTAER
jgi:hypothetical protein